MNRRQFLGASLAGIIAALSLPFEQFATWFRGLFGVRANALAQLQEIGAAYEFRLTSYARLALAVPSYAGRIVLE